MTWDNPDIMAIMGNVGKRLAPWGIEPELAYLAAGVEAGEPGLWRRFRAGCLKDFDVAGGFVLERACAIEVFLDDPTRPSDLTIAAEQFRRLLERIDADKGLTDRLMIVGELIAGRAAGWRSGGPAPGDRVRIKLDERCGFEQNHLFFAGKRGRDDVYQRFRSPHLSDEDGQVGTVDSVGNDSEKSTHGHWYNVVLDQGVEAVNGGPVYLLRYAARELVLIASAPTGAIR